MTVEHVQPVVLAATAAVTQVSGVVTALVIVEDRVYLAVMVVATEMKTVARVPLTVDHAQAVEMAHAITLKHVIVVPLTVDLVIPPAFVETSPVLLSKLALLVPAIAAPVLKMRRGSKSAVDT